jgi:hypothetical protein
LVAAVEVRVVATVAAVQIPPVLDLLQSVVDMEAPFQLLAATADQEAAQVEMVVRQDQEHQVKEILEPVVVAVAVEQDQPQDIQVEMGMLGLMEHTTVAEVVVDKLVHHFLEALVVAVQDKIQIVEVVMEATVLQTPAVVAAHQVLDILLVPEALV